MSKVFVVDTNKQPLTPVHSARARKLLKGGKAAVYRCYPFTIRLKVAIEEPLVSELRIKLDPGSKTTGIAVLEEASDEVVFAAELSHRGQQIKEHLDSRRAIRRSPRNRKTRCSRQMCRMNKYGFVRTGPKEAKFVKGFQTGDIVKATVTSGKKVGTYTGRVAVRATGSFNITTARGTVEGIGFKYCQAVQKMDGYSYVEKLCA